MNHTSTSLPAWDPDRTGVLLIHGLTGSPAEMAPMAKALRRAGYRTAVPLIAGHGAGHKELLATTWQDWLDGLRRDLREFAETCDEVIIVGLCVGGLLGALLAAEDDRVRGLICLSPDFGVRIPGPATPWTRFLLPIAFRVPWLRTHGYWTEKPPFGVKNPRLQQRITQAVAASIGGQTEDYGTFRTYVGTIRELVRLRAAAGRSFADVRCPSLIIHSFEDTMFSIRNSTYIYNQLGATEKQIAFITGCDHVITIDLRRDDVARRVARFIAGLHDAPMEPYEATDEAYSCEISFGLEHVRREAGLRSGAMERMARTTQAGSGMPEAHSVVIRQGPSARLVLAAIGGMDGQATTQSPHGDGEAWRLAHEAIDALAHGLGKRLTVRNIDIDASDSGEPFRCAVTNTRARSLAHLVVSRFTGPHSIHARNVE